MYYEFVGRVYPMEKINVVSVVPHHGVSHHILGPVPCAEASAEGKRPISFKNRDHGAWHHDTSQPMHGTSYMPTHVKACQHMLLHANTMTHLNPCMARHTCQLMSKHASKCHFMPTHVTSCQIMDMSQPMDGTSWNMRQETNMAKLQQDYFCSRLAISPISFLLMLDPSTTDRKATHWAKTKVLTGLYHDWATLPKASSKPVGLTGGEGPPPLLPADFGTASVLGDGDGFGVCGVFITAFGCGLFFGMGAGAGLFCFSYCTRLSGFTNWVIGTRRFCRVHPIRFSIIHLQCAAVRATPIPLPLESSTPRSFAPEPGVMSIKVTLPGPPKTAKNSCVKVQWCSCGKATTFLSFMFKSIASFDPWQSSESSRSGVISVSSHMCQHNVITMTYHDDAWPCMTRQLKSCTGLLEL